MRTITIADIRSSPCKIHAKGINVIGKLQGASVFMFSKSEFLKDIGLGYRKLITKNRTFADNYFETTLCRYVLDLLVFFLIEIARLCLKCHFQRCLLRKLQLLTVFLLTAIPVDYVHYVKISFQATLL